MNPGELKYKIDIYEEVILINDKGFKTSSINEIGTYRAKVENLKTKEIYRLEKINLDVSIKFTVRNIRKKIKETNKIRYNNENYSISYFEDVYDNPNYLIIYCKKCEGKK